jgi:tyrosyl-tRNA synthetase
MSKSLGNYIGIAEPPEEIYGKAMSIPDALIERYLRLVSALPTRDVEDVLKLPPRDAKAALAKQLARRLHGEEAAAAAERDFDRKFRQRDLDALRDTRMPEVSGVSTAADAVLAISGAKSFSEVKRLAEQGGLRVNREKVPPDHAVGDGDVVQYGKGKFVRVRLGE